MANLKEIRGRIVSVASTMQITNAMKMVSAAKLKKAQDAITALRPYANKQRELLENIASTLEGDVGGAFTQKREVEKMLVIAITSNRGLCGGFNSSITKKVNQIIQENQDKQIEVITIGKKIFDVVKKTDKLKENRSDLWEDVSFAPMAEFAEQLMQAYLDKTYDHISIVYNQFKNAAVQNVMNETFLPIEFSDDMAAANLDYIFEPSKEEIVRDLIPLTLKTQLYKAMLDSQAGEHGARMTAMHKATDNADELRRGLVIQYNKERQAAITKEILEIVGGADALAG